MDRAKDGLHDAMGKFLDPLADKVLSSAALLAFVWLGLVGGWMVWIVIVRDFVITGLRSYAEYLDKPIVTTRGSPGEDLRSIRHHLLHSLSLRRPKRATGLRGIRPHHRYPHAPAGTLRMMLTVMLSTVGTGVAYLFDNRKVISELYERLRPARG